MAIAGLGDLVRGCLGLDGLPDADIEVSGAPPDLLIRVLVATPQGPLPLVLEPTAAARPAWQRCHSMQLSYGALPGNVNPWTVPAAERVLQAVQLAFAEAERPARQLVELFAARSTLAPQARPAPPAWQSFVGLYHESDLQPVEEDVFAAAWESGLVAALVRQDAATADQLASRLGLDATACGALLRSLCAMGLALPGDELRWQGTESARELVERRATAVAFRLRTRARWQSMAELVRADSRRENLSAEDWSALADMWAIRSDRDEPAMAAEMAALELASASHLLDLGSGSGLYAAAMLACFPNLRVTLVDYAPALRVAAATLNSKGLLERAALVTAEFFEPHWTPPSDCDVVWFANTIHVSSYGANADLLARLYAAMPHGGRLYVIERLANPFSRESCRSEMAWLVHSKNGRAYTFQEVRSLVCGAGFAIVFEAADRPGSCLVVGLKA